MEGTYLELADIYEVGKPWFDDNSMQLFIVAMFTGQCVGQENTAFNQHTNVCMDKFEGNVVPMVIHKRQRLELTDSGLSYSNFNVTTLKGSV